MQADTALRDKLTGALIGLARATDGNEHLISDASTAAILESLIATSPSAASNEAIVTSLLHRVEEEKRNMVPNCFTCASPCGRTSDFDMKKLLGLPQQVQSLKSQLLQGIRDTASAYTPAARDKAVDGFFYKALIVIGMEEFEAEDMLPILEEWKTIHQTVLSNK